MTWLPITVGKLDTETDESNASEAGSYYAGRLYCSQTTSHGISHEDKTCLVWKANNRDMSHHCGKRNIGRSWAEKQREECNKEQHDFGIGKADRARLSKVAPRRLAWFRNGGVLRQRRPQELQPKPAKIRGTESLKSLKEYGVGLHDRR